MNTPSTNRRDMVWIQPRPDLHQYQFFLRACHKAHVMLSTAFDGHYDFELIIGDNHNDLSVLLDSKGEVSEGTPNNMRHPTNVGQHKANIG